MFWKLHNRCLFNQRLLPIVNSGLGSNLIIMEVAKSTVNWNLRMAVFHLQGLFLDHAIVNWISIWINRYVQHNHFHPFEILFLVAYYLFYLKVLEQITVEFFKNSKEFGSSIRNSWIILEEDGFSYSSWLISQSKILICLDVRLVNAKWKMGKIIT